MNVFSKIKEWFKRQTDGDHLDLLAAEVECEMNHMVKLRHLEMRWNGIKKIEDDAEFLKEYEKFKPWADDYAFFEPTEEISRRILKKLSTKQINEN